MRQNPFVRGKEHHSKAFHGDSFFLKCNSLQRSKRGIAVNLKLCSRTIAVRPLKTPPKFTAQEMLPLLGKCQS